MDLVGFFVCMFVLKYILIIKYSKSIYHIH